MKTFFATIVGLALLVPVSATADETSAWFALESASNDAGSASTSLSDTDTNDLHAIGDTLDLSLQYLDGLVNGGKQRDANIEAMLDSAFGTMDSALQSDGSAAGSFESAFGSLETAGLALENQSFQMAEDAANAASSELFNTQSYIDMYGMDLMQLDFENGELATAIDEWLLGGPPPPMP